MLTIGEFAKATGTSVRTVTRYVNEGKIAPTSRTAGGHMRFSREKIKEFNDIWRDPRGRPRGLPAAETEITAFFTRSGTAKKKGRSTSSRWLRRTLLKRKLASRNFY